MCNSVQNVRDTCENIQNIQSEIPFIILQRQNSLFEYHLFNCVDRKRKSHEHPRSNKRETKSKYRQINYSQYNF